MQAPSDPSPFFPRKNDPLTRIAKYSLLSEFTTTEMTTKTTIVTTPATTSVEETTSSRTTTSQISTTKGKA